MNSAITAHLPQNTQASFLHELADLRARAWGVASGARYADWIDEWDPAAHHHAIYKGGMIVAAFRVTVHGGLADFPHRPVFGSLLDHLPLPIAWFSRLVVAPEWKGKGLSRSLDYLAANEPFNLGANSIVATGGSVSNNQFRHQAMLNHGWTYLGKAIDLIGLPLDNASPPSVYARTRVST